MKAVIFDIGGVVIRDHGLKAKVQAAFPNVAPDTLWKALNRALLPACRGEQSRLACWRSMANGLGVLPSGETLTKLWDSSDFMTGIEVDREVFHLALSLKLRYRLGVVSNTMPEHAGVLREMGVYEPFETLVLSHDAGLTKDDPRIFDVVLRKLQVSASDAVYVDDFEPYVALARRVGMAGILFTNAAALVGSLEATGVSCH